MTDDNKLTLVQTDREMRRKNLLSVTGLFLKLGMISFGGPAAHTALMEQEVVQKRKWITREMFLDILAATNLVPGPNSTEMAIHIGYLRAGWAGLVAAGMAFILPAFFVSLALSFIYTRYGSLPEGQALFYGINPVIIAIILSATYRLGKSAIRGKLQMVLGAAAFVAVMLGVNEILVLLAAGLIGILVYKAPKWLKSGNLLWNIAPFLPFAVHLFQTWFENPPKLVQLTLFFLKVGSLLFGSGMVLFAFIQQDVVERFGWLSQSQLIDAIAVGQMTPGPVLSSATFIGYLVADWKGAVLATTAVFLPSFVIVALMGPFMPLLRRSAAVQAFLKGVNAAVVALMLTVGVSLFQAAVTDLWTFLILIAGLVLVFRLKLDSTWLIAGGAVVGIVHYFLI